MITRKMNTRITIFSKTGGQNEDGEVIAGIRNDVYSCWAEVAKTSVKDFKTFPEDSQILHNLGKQNRSFYRQYHRDTKQGITDWTQLQKCGFKSPELFRGRWRAIARSIPGFWCDRVSAGYRYLSRFSGTVRSFD